MKIDNLIDQAYGFSPEWIIPAGVTVTRESKDNYRIHYLSDGGYPYELWVAHQSVQKVLDLIKPETEG